MEHPRPFRERVFAGVAERVEKGRGAVRDLCAAMDGHYEVIREYLGAERGPGFAHRVNSLLLRIDGQFFQIQEEVEKLAALGKQP